MRGHERSESRALLVAALLAFCARPLCVLAADVDAGGDIDLILADGEGDRIAVLENRGGLGFRFAPVNLEMAPSGAAAADMDDDGDVDIVVASSEDTKLAVIENSGGGTFSTSHVTEGVAPRSVLPIKLF